MNILIAITITLSTAFVVALIGTCIAALILKILGV